MLIFSFPRFGTEARKMTCFCDIRRAGNSNSPLVHDLPNPVVRGTFKGCKAGARECPGKCWHEGWKALGNQGNLNYMCRHHGNIAPPHGIPLIGYVKISNCGTFNTYNYHRKLCCFQTVIPSIPRRVIKYGYFCWL